MSDDSKYTLEEKRSIALEELAKVTGRDISALSLDAAVKEYFPEGEEKSGEDELVGDPARLEFLINLEMKVCKDVFRLNPQHFFVESMTLNQFIDLIQEAEDKSSSQDYENVDEMIKETEEESQDSDHDNDEEELNEEEE